MGINHRVKGVVEPRDPDGRRHWRDLEISGDSGGLITVDYHDNLAYEGHTFHFHRYRTYDPNEIHSYVIMAPNNYVHLNVMVEGVHDCRITTHINPTITKLNKVLSDPPIMRVNHSKSIDYTLQIYLNADIAKYGSYVSSWRQKMVLPLNVILVPNVYYCLRVKNTHTETNHVNLVALWHENEPRVQ